MITFGLLRMIPGNVAVAVMGTNAYRDPGAIKVFNADYGFNLPWYRQYFLWLGTLTTVALFSRYMRSSVLDNLTEDYVRTARAKGASELRVLARHVLRNSMITIATLLGLYLPAILGGALITEAVFNYPGMGYLFYQAAERQDCSPTSPTRRSIPGSGTCRPDPVTKCSLGRHALAVCFRMVSLVPGPRLPACGRECRG